VSRAVSAAQKHQLEIWERYADLVLRPDVQSLAWDDFDRAEEAIAAAPLLRAALSRALKNCLGRRKTLLRISKRGSRVKIKVTYGSRRCLDDAHRRLACRSWRPAAPLA